MIKSLSSLSSSSLSSQSSSEDCEDDKKTILKRKKASQLSSKKFRQKNKINIENNIACTTVNLK